MRGSGMQLAEISFVHVIMLASWQYWQHCHNDDITLITLTTDCLESQLPTSSPQ